MPSPGPFACPWSLGSILVSQLRSHTTTSLMHLGLTSAQAHARASDIAQRSQGAGGSAAQIPHFIRLDFAEATRSVFYVMAAIMAAAAIAALIGLRAGAQEEATTEREVDTGLGASSPTGEGGALPDLAGGGG